MKTIITILALVLFSGISTAQIYKGKSRTPLFFEEYQPAEILLSNGKVLKQKRSNIFLKNASLVYKQGGLPMQANVNVVKAVTFKDLHFMKVDTLLAYVVDSISIDEARQDLLLCARMIDMEAYQHQVANSNTLTNFSLTDMVETTATDASDDDRYELPVIHHYFYRVNGKFVKVHERHIKRAVSKETFRLVRSIMQVPDFSWGNEKYLMQILEIISKDKKHQ